MKFLAMVVMLCGIISYPTLAQPNKKKAPLKIPYLLDKTEGQLDRLYILNYTEGPIVCQVQFMSHPEFPIELKIKPLEYVTSHRYC